MADYAIHEETLTDVADVIRKKDGTSALIDPADYADRINLMGMLEEKTVSGAIAHFDDGADAVPLKSLNAGIAPNLEGVDKVKVTHAGRNLVYPKYTGRTNAGITYTVNADHSITCQGTATGTSWASANWSENPQMMQIIRAGRYFLTGGISSNVQVYLGGISVDGQTSIYSVYDSGNGALYNFTKDFYVYPQIRVNSGTDLTTPITIKIQLEVGETAHDYEQYTEPTEYEVEIPNPNPNLRQTADVDDGMWTTSGTINPSSGGGFGRALTMAVSAKTTYDIYGLLDDLIVYLDSNKTMLSYERLSNTSLSLQNERKTTPANCAYIGLSALAFDVSSVSVKESFLVYGGQIDVISGEGVSGYANASLADKNYYYSSSLQRFDCVLDGVISSGYMDDFIPPQGYTISHLLIQNAINAPDMTMCIYGGKLYLKNLSCSNVSELVSDMSGKYIVYEKATPESFSVSPISVDSKAGTNNIWNDAGDTEVTYRSQGTAYIYPEGEGVSF